MTNLYDYQRWWSEDTVAVVTGGNRGIGLEVCKQLAIHGITVVLTCRDPKKAQQEVTQLGFNNIVTHQLDVQSSHSISNLASWLKQEYGGLDILVNNAAVSGTKYDFSVLGGNKIDLKLLLEDVSLAKRFLINDFGEGKMCFDINYYGVKRVTETLLPLLRPSPAGARIVNVSSGYGKIMHLPNESLRKKLSNPAILSMDFLDSIVENFLVDLEEGHIEDNGWPCIYSAYIVSKVMLNAYTRILNEELASSRDGEKKVCMNVVHPGFTNTDLSFHSGTRSASDAAEGIVAVALFPPNGPTGLFFADKKLIDF